MLDFLRDYFTEPILANGWFNPVNTAVYGIILILAVFLVFRLLRKMNIRVDRYFGIAVLPFILWGSSTRVLHDAAYAGVLSPELNAFYGSPIFPTPGSYVITFSLALLVLLVSLLFQRFGKVSYWKTMFAIGIVLDIVNFILLPIRTLFPFFLITGVTLVFTFPFLYPRTVSKIKHFKTMFPFENIGILGAHFLDASATVVALTLFGYVEQHVVPRLFFPLLGPYAMFFLKILVVLPVLWIIDRYAEERDFRNFLKIVVLILGLAPGLRDMLRLMALV